MAEGWRWRFGSPLHIAHHDSHALRFRLQAERPHWRPAGPACEVESGTASCVDDAPKGGYLA